MRADDSPSDSHPLKFVPPTPKGRGAGTQLAHRFNVLGREAFDDGWNNWDEAAEEALPKLDTEVAEERAQNILSRNDSPDIGFDLSVNPYRGCEHGCIYCYARPTHSYLSLSPGLDFGKRPPKSS